MTMASRPASAWKMEQISRSFLGFLIAPIAGGLASAFMFLAISLPNGMMAGSGINETIALFAVVGASIGALGLPWAFAAGWPIHALLLWRRKTHILVYGCAGAGLAIVAMWLNAFGRFVAYDLIPPYSFSANALAAVGGLAGGVVFWLIRRPDVTTSVSPPASRTPAKAPAA